MSQSFHLVVAIPDADPVAHELESDSVSLGRSPDNDIQVLVAEISKKHATLEREGDGYKIIDSGSSNGTQVDGKEVDPSGVALEDGSALILGKTVPAYFAVAKEGAEVDPAAVVAAGKKKGTAPKAAAVPVAVAADDDAKEGAETVVLQKSPLAPGGAKPPAPAAPAAPAKKAAAAAPAAPAAPKAPAPAVPGAPKAPAAPAAPAPGGAKPPAPAIPAPGGPKKPPAAPTIPGGGPKKPPGA